MQVLRHGGFYKYASKKHNEHPDSTQLFKNLTNKCPWWVLNPWHAAPCKAARRPRFILRQTNCNHVNILLWKGELSIQENLSSKYSTILFAVSRTDCIICFILAAVKARESVFLISLHFHLKPEKLVIYLYKYSTIGQPNK